MQKDVMQKMSDAPLTTCPECGKQTFAKQLTAAGFQLKGSGYYATDFKNGPQSKAVPKGEAAGSGAAVLPPVSPLSIACFSCAELGSPSASRIFRASLIAVSMSLRGSGKSSFRAPAVLATAQMQSQPAASLANSARTGPECFARHCEAPSLRLRPIAARGPHPAYDRPGVETGVAA
jgi:putative FmdB family regulatory protein